MWKNIFLISSLLFLGMSFSCVVSTTTGKITIKNTSKTAISNVYIGDRLIALYVASGASYDYYYYYYFEGKLKLDGIENSTYEYFSENNTGEHKKDKWKKYINDIKLKLYTDCWIEIHADTAKENYAFLKDQEYNEVSGTYEYIDDYGEYDWITDDPDDNEDTIFKQGDDYIECSLERIGEEYNLSKDSWLE